MAKILFVQTYVVDISNIDNVKRNSHLANIILQSYSRNICTLADNKTIYQDVKSTNEAANHLLKIEDLIKKYNEKEKQCPLRLPDLKLIITATQYGYKRADGVLVITIGCLKD